MKLEKLVNDAKASKFGMFKLNFALGFVVPFNRPHKIKILEIQDDTVKTIIPFRKKNFNHIKSIHACGMATAAEFASGFFMLIKLGSQKYRLIMESIEMKYHYQAKTDVIATFSANEDWVDEMVKNPLQNQDSVFIRCEILLHDTQGNLVATGYTNWQIKEWSKVKTKV